MSYRKFFLFILMLVFAWAAGAQSLLTGVDFTTRFDNREYSASKINESQTLFSARLTPKIGVEWQEKNRLIFGVDLLQDFGDNTKFLTSVRPLLYYRFATPNVRAAAGIFDRKELMGNYPRALFSSSSLFYDNCIAGFMGSYKSTARDDSYVELVLDWEGMKSEASREKFRIFSSGRYTFGQRFYFGYALSVFHFACSELSGEQNVSDNMFANPYIGSKFTAFFDFDIKTGFLAAPQRVRMYDEGWKVPCGAQIDFSITRWGVILENNLYIGENLQPYYDFGGAQLYAGERFYGTPNNIYNRTMLGYSRRFFSDTVRIDAGMVFHFDGKNMGTQQVIKLSANLEKLFNIGKK